MGIDQQSYPLPPEDGDTSPKEKTYYTRPYTEEELRVVGETKRKILEFTSRATPLIEAIEEKAYHDTIGLQFEGKGVDIRYHEGQDLEVTIREDNSDWTLGIDLTTNNIYVKSQDGTVQFYTALTDEESVKFVEQTLSNVEQLLESMAEAESLR